MILQVLKQGQRVEVTVNVFCPTGKGGGVDPTCGKGNKTVSAGRYGQHPVEKDTVLEIEGIKGVHSFAGAFVPERGFVPENEKGRPTRSEPLVKYIEISKIFGTERGTNAKQVQEIAKHVESGKRLPLIEVMSDGQREYSVIDGNHRLDAIKMLSKKGKIPVKVYPRMDL